MDWDEQVSEKLSKEWIKINEELESINQFKIPRWYGTVTACGVELHGFCDASTKAYACVIYCRLKYNKQSIILVAAKSKLVPLKKHISLPRLELCGALLLAKLMAKVKKCLEGQELHVFGWSDSTAVLGWLQGNPSRWKTFVSNRTTQITDIIPPQSWRYVKSSENPADCGSRGLTASQLQDYQDNYIYFCCGKCKLRTVCGNQVNAHQLTHSGLITVDFGCIIKSDNFEVIAHQQRTSDVSISAKVFSPVIASINHVINVTIPQDVLNESSKESDQELQGIQDRIKTMKENGVIEESMSYHDIHHYTVIYGVISVVAAGLGVYACRRARCARAPAPAAPAPGGATSSNVPASQHVASVGDSVVYQCVSERAKVASARVLDKATSPVLGSYTSISNL